MTKIKNMPALEIYEVVVEYQALIEGMEEEVKGRVLKMVYPENNKFPYVPSFSHSCKPTLGATSVYAPENPTDDFEYAKSQVISYLRLFSNIETEKNIHF